MRHAQTVSGTAFIAEMMQATNKVADAVEMLDVILKETSKLSETFEQSRHILHAIPQAPPDDQRLALEKLYEAYHTASEQSKKIDELRDKLRTVEEAISNIFVSVDKFYDKVLGRDEEDVSMEEVIEYASSELSEVLDELNAETANLAQHASQTRKDLPRLTEALRTMSGLLDKHGSVTKECEEYLRKILYPLAAHDIADILPTLETLDSRLKDLAECSSHFLDAMLTVIAQVERTMK